MNDGSDPAQCSSSFQAHFQVKAGSVHVLPPSDERRTAMLIGFAWFRSPPPSCLASQTATRSPFGAVQSAGIL